MSKFSFSLPSLRFGGSPNEDEIRKQVARRCAEIAQAIADAVNPAVEGQMGAGKTVGALLVAARIKAEFGL